MKLINSLQPLVGLLKSITCKVPNEFLTLDSNVLKASGDTEATIGVWTRESPHNYENNSRIHEVSATCQLLWYHAVDILGSQHYYPLSDQHHAHTRMNTGLCVSFGY